MDNKDRIIDVEKMYDECNNRCGNRSLSHVKGACKECIYDALMTKIETEKVAQERIEKEHIDKNN